MDNKNKQLPADDFDPYGQLVKEQAPELFCDTCGHYPIEPVHGHFVCPACKMPTKCCEGMPLNV
jgi:hypothetical protein